MYENQLLLLKLQANHYYKLFIMWTNQKIRKTFVKRNMFDFKHIKVNLFPSNYFCKFSKKTTVSGCFEIQGLKSCNDNVFLFFYFCFCGRPLLIILYCPKNKHKLKQINKLSRLPGGQTQFKSYQQRVPLTNCILWGYFQAFNRAYINQAAWLNSLHRVCSNPACPYRSPGRALTSLLDFSIIPGI